MANDSSSSPTQSVQLKLGTRASPLAVAQAEETRERLCAAHGWPLEAVELVKVTASGDKVLDRPLAEIGGKALWTKELDQWLAEGVIDASVHSAKDVETLRPDLFTIAACLPRADRRDSLIGAGSIADLPKGARVGTSAPRRAAQLKHLRPDLEVVMFRGNVATRLSKLEAGEADATFLAAAGLARLGQSDAGTPLDTQEWIPAAGQGVIAIECAAANARVCELLSAINDTPSMAELMAERALLAQLGGTCHSPVAAQCNFDAGTLSMRAALFSEDGAERVDGEAQFDAGDANAPAALARELLAKAGPEITRHFNATS